MNTSMQNNIVTIELDGVKHTITRSQARMLINTIFAVFFLALYFSTILWF